MKAVDVRAVLERAELSAPARVVALARLVGSSSGARALVECLGLSEHVVRDALEELRCAGPAEPGAERPPPPLSAAREAESWEASLSSTKRALMVSWSEAWLSRFGPAPPAQLAAVRELAPWLVDYARRRPESSEELAGVMEAFFVAKSASRHRPRVEWLAEDPGRYLDPDLALVEAEAERGARARAAASEGSCAQEAREQRALERGRARAEDSQRERYGSGPVPVGSVLLALLRDGGEGR